MQTCFLLPELPFCRQPYRDHMLAFSAPQREQHVCLGEKNKLLISCFDTVNSGLLFAQAVSAKIHLCNLLVHYQTMMQLLFFLTTLELVLIVQFYVINVFDVFGLLSQWLNLLRQSSNGQFQGHIVEKTHHPLRQPQASLISF